MKKIIDFNSKQDRLAITEQQKALGFRVLEVQYYNDGNHIIFTDEPYIEPEKPRDLFSEIDTLEAKISTLDTRIKLIENKEII